MASTTQPIGVATDDMLKDAVERKFVGNMFLFGFKTNPFRRTNSQKARYSPVKLSSVLRHYGKAVNDDKPNCVVAWQMLPANDRDNTPSVIMELRRMMNVSSQSSCISSADESSLLGSDIRFSQFNKFERRCSGEADDSSGMNEAASDRINSDLSLQCNDGLIPDTQGYEREQCDGNVGHDLRHRIEGMHGERCDVYGLPTKTGDTKHADVEPAAIEATDHVICDDIVNESYINDDTVDLTNSEHVKGTCFDDTLNLAVIQKYIADTCDSSTIDDVSSKTRGHGICSCLDKDNSLRHSVQAVDTSVQNNDMSERTRRNQHGLINSSCGPSSGEHHSLAVYSESSSNITGEVQSDAKSCHVMDVECATGWDSDNSSLLICREDLRVFDQCAMSCAVSPQSICESPQSGPDVRQMCNSTGLTQLARQVSIPSDSGNEEQHRSESADCRNVDSGADTTCALRGMRYDDMPESEDLDAFLKLADAIQNEHQLCDLSNTTEVDNSCASLEHAKDERYTAYADAVTCKQASYCSPNGDAFIERSAAKLDELKHCPALADEGDIFTGLDSSLSQPFSTSTGTKESERRSLTRDFTSASENCSFDLFDSSCSIASQTSPRPRMLRLSEVMCISPTQESRLTPSVHVIECSKRQIRLHRASRSVHYARRLSTVQSLDSIDMQMISTPTPDAPRVRRQSCLKSSLAAAPTTDARLTSSAASDFYDGSQELFSLSPASDCIPRVPLRHVFRQSTPKLLTQPPSPLLAEDMPPGLSVTKQAQNIVCNRAIAGTRQLLESINTFDSPDLFTDSYSESSCACSLDADKHNFRSSTCHPDSNKGIVVARTRVVLGDLVNAGSSDVGEPWRTGQVDPFSQDLFSQSIEAADVSLCRKLFQLDSKD